MKVKKNNILVRTEDKYDDYEIVSIYKILKDFDSEKILSEYLLRTKRKIKSEPLYYSTNIKTTKLFYNWLERNKYIEDVTNKSVEWWELDEPERL